LQHPLDQQVRLFIARQPEEPDMERAIPQRLQLGSGTEALDPDRDSRTAGLEEREHSRQHAELGGRGASNHQLPCRSPIGEPSQANQSLDVRENTLRFS